MHAIEVKNLKKEFKISKNKQVSALNEISFTVNQGEIFGFIGPNGAGKTTTIKILLGFLPPTTGEIRVMGHNPENARLNVRIGYMPEEHSYYPHLKVKVFLKYLAELSSSRRAASATARGRLASWRRVGERLDARRTICWRRWWRSAPSRSPRRSAIIWAPRVFNVSSWGEGERPIPP